MIAALDAATGRPLWTRKLPSAPFGCATVAADVVFAPTYDGLDLRALGPRRGRSSGATARRPGSTAVHRSRATRCSCLRAHPTATSRTPVPQLIAYRLSSVRIGWMSWNTR